MRVSVEISPGELYDKISILRLKSDRISDKSKLKFIRAECKTLVRSADLARDKLVHAKNLSQLIDDLDDINSKIWDIEDNIRDCERRQDFCEEFVELARSVYINNDERARIKRDINTLFNSDIQEAKSYTEYK